MNRSEQLPIAYEQAPADPVNYYHGRQGHGVNQIVLHSMDGFVKGTVQLFATPRPSNPTSAHYSIGWDGNILQHVDEADTAYHAGDLLVNFTSIGIEHEDLGTPYITRSDALYETSAELVADICSRYSIPCDKSHVRVHSEVSDAPTSCPTGLDRDRIVNRANQIIHAHVGGETITPGLQQVTIVAELGANVRSAPVLSGTNVVAKFPKGTTFSVEKWVQGEAPAGETNNIWWKVAGSNEFVWSGITNDVPQPPAPVTPPAPSVPPVLPTETTISMEALKAQIDQLKKDYSAALGTVTTLTKENSMLQATVQQVQSDNRKLSDDLSNYNALKTSNEILSGQVQIYQDKQKNSLVTAFSGWELYDLPKGRALLTRLGLALRILLLPINAPYVVGWKDHVQLQPIGNP